MELVVAVEVLFELVISEKVPVSSSVHSISTALLLVAVQSGSCRALEHHLRRDGADLAHADQHLLA